MITLIGGAIAAVLGLIGLSIWFGKFLEVVAGVLPIILLLGGGLALYLGFDELKDNWKKDKKEDASTQADKEEYEKEIADLKKEIDDLKK